MKAPAAGEFPEAQYLRDRIPSRGVANAFLHGGFVVAGVVTTLLGPILPILIGRWSMSDARAGLFFTSQFCGNLAGIASFGTLIYRRGYRLTLMVGFVCIALGVGLLGVGDEWIDLVSTGVYGYGLGLVLSGTNLWVAEAAPSRRAAALSVLNLAWGIGAIACPGLVLLAERNHRLGLLLFSIAGSSAFLALALAPMDLEPHTHSPDGELPPRVPSVTMRSACALGSLFFLYVGAETSVGGWAAALARRLGPGSGNPWELAPMFFWAGLLGGRAAGPMILSRVTERAALAVGLTLAAICDAALVRVASLQSAAICLVLIGGGFSCIYPLLVALLVDLYGKRATRAGSILFALASLGGATMPWLVGFTATKAGSLRAGLLVPLAACLIMVSLLRPLRAQSLA